MSSYIKVFGKYGATPASVFVKEDGNIAEWKTVEKTLPDKTTYYEQYGLFSLSVSKRDGKDDNGATKYKNSNRIFVKIKNKAIFDYLLSMQERDAKYYLFYGAVDVNDFHCVEQEIQKKDGQIYKETRLTVEWCELNNADFKIIPVFDKKQEGDVKQEQQSTQQTNEQIQEEQAPLDDDIPF